MKVSVTIDTREKREELFLDLLAHPDVEEVEWRELPASDIEINGIGFERKTVPDYASSLQEGRLEEQVLKLSERYEFSYLLLEGDIAETTGILASDMNGSSLRGSMSSLTAREGIEAVIPCSNTELLADMAVRIARKHLEPSNREYLQTSDVDVGSPVTMQMYGCIEGVGPKTAEMLYNRWPSIHEFTHSATIDDLEDIDGIGTDTALSIIEQVT